MNVVRKCLGASRRALCGLAARLLAKAAHLLMWSVCAHTPAAA